MGIRSGELKDVNCPYRCRHHDVDYIMKPEDYVQGLWNFIVF